MEAGRELDALVAEKVFGLVRCTADSHRGSDGATCYALPESPMMGGELRSYSTDIAAAWEVVEKIHALGWCSTLSALPDPSIIRYEMDFDKPPLIDSHHTKVYAIAATAPHAICLAALKAIAPAGPPSVDPRASSGAPQP